MRGAITRISRKDGAGRIFDSLISLHREAEAASTRKLSSQIRRHARAA